MFVVIAITAACLALESPARAQAEDQAAARVLFEDARRLMQEGHHDAACPKLEAASKLYPGSGVLLNLSDCYEHLGRTASAWTTFGEAAAAASRLGRTADEAEAKRRQAALGPKLTRLVIRVTHDTPGLVVTRDGKPIDRPLWGTALPVDPGTHVASASAPGRQTWEASIGATEPGKTVTLDVPELPPTPTAASSAAPPQASASSHAADEKPPSSSPWPGRRVLGVVLAGSGAVAMGVGGVLGLSAKAQYDEATGQTGDARHESSVRAVDTGNLATLVFVGGAAVTTAGLVLWLTAPRAPAAVGMNGRELFLHGRF